MPRDAVNWIGLLAPAIALHDFSNSFQPIYPGDTVALAVFA